MMANIEEHYNAYPYPERDPMDEHTRLIEGSPSNPIEMDHFLFGGKRDWTKPLHVLVAGGGSGDGLIQIAQKLTDAKRPYKVTYIDLSVSTRKIAEERVRIRNLKNITFITGSLLNASDHGEFDYIDCCGVLHHLKYPQEGFNALANALAPHGGLGFMVYAPYGRSGLYPLQEAFGELSQNMSPQERLAFGKDVFQRIPQNHPFKKNELLGDHKISDAGFYDLLLHSQDVASTVTEVFENLKTAGLELANFTQPALYSLDNILPSNFTIPNGITRMGEMQLAEKLRGNLKTHVGYAHRAGEGINVDPTNPDGIPHFIGEDPKKAEKFILERGGLPVTLNGLKIGLGIPPAAAKLLGRVDGRTSVSGIQVLSGMTVEDFNGLWKQLSGLLSGYGLLLYSSLNEQ